MAKPNAPEQKAQQSEKQAKVEKIDKDFRHLVRISNLDIDGKKKVVFGLSMLKGIAPRTAKIVCDMVGIDTSRRIGNLTEEESEKLEEAVKQLPKKVLPWILNRRKVFDTGESLHMVGSDLLVAEREDITRMKKIRSYKGIRHELGLPVRGQRTKTWGRGKVSVGVSRLKAEQVAKAKKAEEAAAAKPGAAPAAAAAPAAKAEAKPAAAKPEVKK